MEPSQSNSLAISVEPRTHGVAPRIRAARCGGDAQGRLLRAFEIARTWAHSALAALSTLHHGSAASVWNAGPLRASFGAFRPRHARRVQLVWRAVVTRFERGFRHGAVRRPVVIDCFPSSHDRCGEGLLGNANHYGRLRLCPQLLHRSDREIAAVILHEIMHQRLGVDDQRHDVCVPDRKRRCYRENADRLVEHGRSDLAVRNIDNYVRFAMRISGSPHARPGRR